MLVLRTLGKPCFKVGIFTFTSAFKLFVNWCIHNPIALPKRQMVCTQYKPGTYLPRYTELHVLQQPPYFLHQP